MREHAPPRDQQGATDNGDVLFNSSRSDFQLTFAAYLRIEGTCDGLVAIEGALKAAFVAPDTGTNILRMVGLGLFRPLRVGPERASKANKISLSGGNNLFSKVRGSNRAGGYNWDGDRLLYLSGRPGVVAVAHCHRRGLMNHSVVVTAGDVECIDALVFQHFSQRYCLLNREAVRFIVCAAQADGNRKVRPTFLRTSRAIST